MGAVTAHSLLHTLDYWVEVNFTTFSVHTVPVIMLKNIFSVLRSTRYLACMYLNIFTNKFNMFQKNINIASWKKSKANVTFTFHSNFLSFWASHNFCLTITRKRKMSAPYTIFTYHYSIKNNISVGK